MPRSLFLAEVLAALSHALDLTEGQPEGHSIRSCILGIEIGRARGLDFSEQSALFYALLLKDAGCSANAAPVADLFGSDDHPVKKDLKTTDWSSMIGAGRYILRNVAQGRSGWAKLRHLSRLAVAGPPGARALTRIRCERGAAIVRDLGFPEATAEAIRYLDEHWDGKGHPYGRRAEEIPLLSRIACLAQVLDVFLVERGVDEMLAMVRARRGTWFDPGLADLVLSWSGRISWWEGVRGSGRPEDLRGLEPRERLIPIDEEGLDRVSAVFAQVIDAKTPFTARHSTRVAAVAAELMREVGGGEEAVRLIHRAGLLHDIGKLGVSNRILDKPDKLTDEEFAQVKLHPRYTHEILSNVAAFADVLEPAANHHERIDGRGYPRGLDGGVLDLPCRILAVADVYEALTAERPYRASLEFEEVARILRSMSGPALDGDLVECLLRCARHQDVAPWGWAALARTEGLPQDAVPRAPRAMAG
ncbi:MAG: HD domain-containing phosphohydrolase [Gemmatimonadota bacterium]|nr:HD domain-containing protein [Gemmatimonadota bacterium]